jgi:hypothetical protein
MTNKKQNLIRRIIGTALIGATLAIAGCNDSEKAEYDPLAPPKSGQSIRADNCGERVRITLYDMDGDGQFDLKERLSIGYSPGCYSHRFFIKKGYSVPRFPETTTKVEVVEPEFFKAYE